MDMERLFSERAREAFLGKDALFIRGGRTKGFLGRPCSAELMDVSGHCGIVEYDPKELVITARCGTKMEEIERVLSDSNQMLAFEPPKFGNQATLGGTIACGLSGPRRPHAGALRDHLLGCRIVNGRGEILNFGGKVMKNVAGFDASRLMAGAFGTLGLILEASLKVLPTPAASLTVTRECASNEAIRLMNDLASQPIPLDGAAHAGGICHLRLSGSSQAVLEARASLGGELLENHESFWEALREHRLSFFDAGKLWRIACPPAAAMPDPGGEWLIEWGGAQRWLKSEAPNEEVRRIATSMGGHATLYRGEGDPFHPLPPSLFALHKRIKDAFDPHGIFNRGILYPEF